MSAPVLLRTAASSDLPAILAFWQIAAEDAHRPVDTTEALEVLIARDPDALLVAVDPGADTVVGTVIAGWDGWRCHVYRLAVHPDRRREGIAGLLIAAAENRFRTLGGTRADAMVLDENALAHHAWRAGGYLRQPEWSRWVKPL